MIKKILVKKAKNGDKKAFQELIELDKDKLYRLAYIYTNNENDALDVFQETILKAMNSINTLKEERYFSTWITRILINNAKDLIRKKNNVIPMDTLALLKIESSHDKEFGDDNIDILAALDNLGEKEKSALILRFYNDYTIHQVASIMDIPEGSVKSLIHRALRKVKNHLRGGIVNG